MTGQTSSSNDFKTPWARVDDVAAAARTDDEASIRALTDFVLNLSTGGRAAQSIRGRVFMAELNYRQGSHAGISIKRVVMATNDVVIAVGALDFVRTSDFQIGLTRKALATLCPHLIQPEGTNMSPAEAIFVMYSVLHNKTNDEFQLPPEQWEAEVRKHMAEPVGPNQSKRTRVVVSIMSPTSRAVLDAIRAVSDGASVEGSGMTRRVHEFLDAIGL